MGGRWDSWLWKRDACPIGAQLAPGSAAQRPVLCPGGSEMGITCPWAEPGPLLPVSAHVPGVLLWVVSDCVTAQLKTCLGNHPNP